TEHHFTGKERDVESGLEYFFARYFTSDLGRFMTPDWADKPTDVPYAHFGNPQSLNLYAYVGNNPLGGTDANGHCGMPQQTSNCGGGPPDPGQMGSRPICWCSAPTLPNGQPAPPSIPVPGGSGANWKWNPNSQNSRGGSWGPDKWDGKTQGSPPSASWDDKPGKNGTEHWDVDDGKGGRTRVDKDGKSLTPEEAHGKSPMQSVLDGINDIGKGIGDWEYDQWQGIKNELNKMPGGSNYHPSPTAPCCTVPLWETE
ncbi:MAG: RHS repeat-associated core domain-containing protein, partial [Terracidiphilus sp.]